MRPHASQSLLAGLVVAFVGWSCTTPAEPGETEEPTATQLVMRTQPGNATSGVALGTQPIVEIQDASGVVVTSDNTTIVAAAIATGGGTLGGSVTITGASGVVSFTDLAISGLVGNRTLTFSAAGLTSATSDAFELTGEPTGELTATQLVMRTQPGNATSGVALGTQPVVEIQDASGVVVTSDNTTIVAAAIATGGGTIGGSVTITGASGVVSFTDLAISGLVGNRTLTFSAAGLTSATSDAFELRPGPVSAAASTVDVSSPTAAPGDTVTLTLIARDAEVNQQQEGGLTVTFTATEGSSEGTIGATVDRLDGTYTAVFTATGAGTAVIIGATIAGNAVTSQLPTITVLEPADVSVLVSEDFEDDDFAARGWYDMGNPQTSTTDNIDGSVRSLEMRFNQGETSPVGSIGRHLFDETATVYLSYWVKYSENWVGSQVSFHPHEFFFLTNQDGAYVGPNGASFSLLIEQNHNLTTGMVPRVGDNDDDKWVLGSQIFTDAPGPWYKNDWHFVEVLVEMNSAVGVADGVIQYWLDGELIMDADDVLLRAQDGEENMLFNQLLIGPFIGVGSPEAQTWWIDDLTVATGRTTGP